ncbi:hypothetical protein CTI12_AA002960 [Artemisia annua]|uniref:Uncharacterized protein n=1 Tax=Artemisia annua TaxID=35608 RepID=A0A2U1QP43_ARTAN|nr:hypothetical protein CTI12_AA002960 [Artemisia annua]
MYLSCENSLCKSAKIKDFGPTTRKDGNLKLVKEVVDPNRWSDQTDPESALLLNGPKTNLTGGSNNDNASNLKVTDSAYVKNQLFDDLRPSSAFDINAELPNDPNSLFSKPSSEQYWTGNMQPLDSSINKHLASSIPPEELSLFISWENVEVSIGASGVAYFASFQISCDYTWIKVSRGLLLGFLLGYKGCIFARGLRVMGTFGYVVLEYANNGLLNQKSDVYSFGVQNGSKHFTLKCGQNGSFELVVGRDIDARTSRKALKLSWKSSKPPGKLCEQKLDISDKKSLRLVSGVVLRGRSKVEDFLAFDLRMCEEGRGIAAVWRVKVTCLHCSFAMASVDSMAATANSTGSNANQDTNSGSKTAPTLSYASLFQTKHSFKSVNLCELRTEERDLMANPKCSLLVAKDPEDRTDMIITLYGDAIPVHETQIDDVRASYLVKHPDAFWVDFSDFQFFRIEPIVVSFVSGVAIALYDQKSSPIRSIKKRRLIKSTVF